VAEMRQALAPLWARIVDDFIVMGETHGRFLEEHQLVGVMHTAHERAMREASEEPIRPLYKMHKDDLLRLLKWQQHMIGTEAGTDYLPFCEMLAPDLLSRRAFQLHSSLRNKNGAGACVAELQYALKLGRVAADDILTITDSPQLAYPSQLAESARPRIPFSKMCRGLKAVADLPASPLRGAGPPRPPALYPALDLAESSSVRGPPRAPGVGGIRSTRRGDLERDLQAACDGIASAQTYADIAPKSLAPVKSAGSLKHMKPFPVGHKEEDLFMSKFQSAQPPSGAGGAAASAANDEEAVVQRFMRDRFLQDHAQTPARSAGARSPPGTIASMNHAASIPRPVTPKAPEQPPDDDLEDM